MDQLFNWKQKKRDYLNNNLYSISYINTILQASFLFDLHSNLLKYSMEHYHSHFVLHFVFSYCSSFLDEKFEIQRERSA